jgi:hypothetical protein
LYAFSFRPRLFTSSAFLYFLSSICLQKSFSHRQVVKHFHKTSNPSGVLTGKETDKWANSERLRLTHHMHMVPGHACFAEATSMHLLLCGIKPTELQCSHPGQLIGEMPC